MHVYLVTLGSTCLRTSGEDIPLSAREAALLSFLAQKPHGRATRAEITSLFWPNSSEKKARHSLSQLLYALKAQAPPLLLVSEGDYLTAPNLDADIVALNRDIANGDKRSALERYKGPFLGSFDTIGGSLRDWRDENEEIIARIISELLQEWSHVCASAELDNTIRLCKRILDVHPHMIAAHIALLEATSRTAGIEQTTLLYQTIHDADPEYASALPPLSSFQSKATKPSESHVAPFAGRQKELSALLAAWDKTQSGEGQLVVVLGEPGIGKTRLADQLLRRVAIRGGAAWVVNCCAATQHLTYSGAHDLMRDYVLVSDNATDSAGVRDVDWALNLADGSAPDEYRHALTERITISVVNRSRKQPLAILVDDAQWADEYTAVLLAYWAYRLRCERVMLILTVRTHEADPLPDWVTSDLGRPIHLRIGRIGIAAAETIIEAFERHYDLSLERSTKDAVLWQSGGRPFLLLEALASRLLEDNPNQPDSPVPLTESAELLLLRRFRNLSVDALTLVSMLAVWGRPVSDQILLMLSGLSEEAFAGGLSLLHARGIAHLQHGEVAFPHDLMRETAYRTVPPPTKVLYHRRAARHLAAVDAPPALVAQHYANTGDAWEAGSYCLEAACSALQSHAYTDFEYYCRLCMSTGAESHKKKAAVQLGRYLIQVGRSTELNALLPLLSDDTDDSTLLRAIASLEADLASGTKSAIDLLTFATTIATDAVARQNPAQSALVATLLCIAFDACTADFDYSTDMSIDALSEGEHRIHLQSVASVWHGVSQGVGLALTMCETTLRTLTADTSPNARAACLYSYGTLLLLDGRVVRAQAQFNEALHLAQQTGDVRRQTSVYINSAVALLESDDLAGAKASLEKAATATNVHFRIRCFTNLAIVHYEAGDSALAKKAAETVLSMNATYQSPALGSISHAILGLIALQDGRIDTARECYESITEQPWDSLGDVSYTAIFLARMLASEGNPTEGIALIDHTVANTRARDTLCTMRMECEKAKFLTTLDVDGAYGIAHRVNRLALQLGARRVASRAQEVLTAVRMRG